MLCIHLVLPNAAYLCFWQFTMVPLYNVVAVQATLEAQREAGERKLQDQAVLELERERSRLRDKELLAQQSVTQPEQRGEGELDAELARLEMADTRHREEIGRSVGTLLKVHGCIYSTYVHDSRTYMHQ